MILNTRHVGIVVRDIEKSLLFYRDLLGFEVINRSVEAGDYIENVVGIKDVRLEWVKLRAKDNFVVELLQYHSHPSDEIVKQLPVNRIGCSHIAFTVEDLDSLYDFLQRNDIPYNSAPQISPNGSAKVLYCYDPDGIILELVEEL